MRSPRGGAQPFSAPRTSVRGAGHTSGLAENNNNKIMAPNAHLGTDHTWAAPFLCERRGARPPACRGSARSAGRDRRVRRWAGRQAGNHLIKRIHRGGRLPPPPRLCPRRARERRAPPAAAAGGRSPRRAPQSPAWRGAAASSASSAAASRRTRSPRGRPPPLPPAAARPPPPRPSGAPRSRTGAPRRRSSIPGSRRPPRTSSARRPGKRDTRAGGGGAGHGWGPGVFLSRREERVPQPPSRPASAPACWRSGARAVLTNSSARVNE